MILTDYHCHILPGLDDGAIDLAASLEMASSLACAGFSRICCTPHRIYGVYDTPAHRVRSETQSLQNELNSAAIELELVPGLEYYLDEFYPELIDNDPLLLPGNLLLAEIPSRCNDFDSILFFLSYTLSKGMTPLIAHPERSLLLSPVLPSSPSTWRNCLGAIFPSAKKVEEKVHFPNEYVQQLLKMGCKFQGNLGSFSGLYGESARQYASLYFQAGYYCCYGSDAHQPHRLSEYLHNGMIATGMKHQNSPVAT